MEKGDLYGERKREENKESRNQASDQRKPWPAEPHRI